MSLELDHQPTSSAEVHQPGQPNQQQHHQHQQPLLLQVQQRQLQQAVAAAAKPSIHQHHASVKLPLSLSIIFGSFTLGFYVAIQGPTLMDLIDLLHVNNDIMSHSLAFASLAYSVGGLLSGFLFNYVDRQMLIPAYYVVFGCANIITPYITNYYVFTVITVFKMMCAGGTDCGANVWILDMWPGKDAWLQALHFSFAIGCALGPLVVEPFLSAVEHKGAEQETFSLEKGTALINSENGDSRIHIPYGLSGAASLLAAVFIVWLYFIERRYRLEEKEKGKQVSALEAGLAPAGPGDGGTIALTQVISRTPTPTPQRSTPTPTRTPTPRQSQPEVASPTTIATIANTSNTATATATAANPPATPTPPQPQPQPPPPANKSVQLADWDTMKFTSKVRDHHDGRPPYYVMFAIILSAMCLSFYCGIEITSMNYLATFAVNIDLQLPKSTAALMSSALTISFAVGRLFGIWIAAYMRPHKLFYLCSAVMALGNVFILLFANTTEMLLWYSICLFGIGCGPMYASIVSFYDDKIAKVTNTVSGIFILGSMFNVALNTLIIGHYIIDNALILIVCNLIGAVLLLLLFGCLHMLTKIKKSQRKKKFKAAQTKVRDSIKQREEQLEQQQPLHQQPQVQLDPTARPVDTNEK